MAEYRYLLGNLLTGAVLEEAPFDNARWTDALNAPGSFEGSLALNQPASVLAKLRPLLPGAIGQLALYVERDGVIIWGGVPWTWQADLDQGKGTLRGEGWHSYLRRRTLRETKVYQEVDQAFIVGDLLNTTLTTGLAPDIDISGVDFMGVDRDRTWQAYERPWIGQLIEDLAAVENGFDFRYESAWDGDTITTRFITTFPNTGRATGFIFEIGKGVTAATLSTDATSLASHVDAIGAGEGDAGLIASVDNAPLIGVYPLLDDVVSYTDVSVFATLDAHARRRLAKASTPVTLPALRVDPAAEPTIGSYIVGDIARVRGGYGLGQVDDLFRLVQIDGSADDTGREEAALTFASLAAFQPS